MQYVLPSSKSALVTTSVISSKTFPHQNVPSSEESTQHVAKKRKISENEIVNVMSTQGTSLSVANTSITSVSSENSNIGPNFSQPQPKDILPVTTISQPSSNNNETDVVLSAEDFTFESDDQSQTSHSPGVSNDIRTENVSLSVQSSTEPQSLSGEKPKKKKKRVSWAPDDQLVQVHIFTKEEGEERHKDFKSALKEQLKDERNQLTLLKKKEEEEWRRKTAEMVPTVIWIPPPKIDTSEFVTKLGLGLKSEETDRQIAREKTIFMAAYLKDADIPPNPRDPPPEVLVKGIYDDNEVVNIPFEEIVDEPPRQVDVPGTNLIQQLLSNPQLLLQALTANSKQQPQQPQQLQQPQQSLQLLSQLPQPPQQPQQVQLPLQAQLHPQQIQQLQQLQQQQQQQNVLALLNLLSQITQRSQQQQQSVIQMVSPTQSQVFGIGTNLPSNLMGIPNIGANQSAFSYGTRQPALVQQVTSLSSQLPQLQQQLMQTSINYGRNVPTFEQTYPYMGHETYRQQHGELLHGPKGEGRHGSHGLSSSYMNANVTLQQNPSHSHNSNSSSSCSDIVNANASRFNSNALPLASSGQQT